MISGHQGLGKDVFVLIQGTLSRNLVWTRDALLCIAWDVAALFLRLNVNEIGSIGRTGAHLESWGGQMDWFESTQMAVAKTVLP